MVVKKDFEKGLVLGMNLGGGGDTSEVHRAAIIQDILFISYPIGLTASWDIIDEVIRTKLGVVVDPYLVIAKASDVMTFVSDFTVLSDSVGAVEFGFYIPIGPDDIGPSDASDPLDIVAYTVLSDVATAQLL